MSSYETNPAGLGVGKRYGPLHLGGKQGGKKGYGSENEAVFEISFEELAASAAQAIKIPAYSKITNITVTVDEVFGTGDTFAINMDGNPITEAAVPVSALGITNPALQSTTAANLVNDTTSAVDLVLDTALIDAGTPETGSAKIVVEYIKL